MVTFPESISEISQEHMQLTISTKARFSKHQGLYAMWIWRFKFIVFMLRKTIKMDIPCTRV